VSRPGKGIPLHGWLLIDKAEGMTSTRCVSAVRRITGAAKAGHGGTLDPLATGLLPIALGEATKTVPYVMDAGKIYRFTARWGEATSTDDREGEVVQRSDLRPDRAAILAALPAFLGRIQQRPPAFSALKVDGERAYDLARAGAPPDLALRAVDIAGFELLSQPDADHAEFEVTCGKGTYIRALARDMGEKLGCFAHVSALRRLAVGRFSVTGAFSLDSLAEVCQNHAAQAPLLPIETALDDIPALVVTGPQAERFRHGQSVRIAPSGVPFLGDGNLVVKADGKAIGLGQVVAGEVRPVRIFNH